MVFIISWSLSVIMQSTQWCWKILQSSALEKCLQCSLYLTEFTAWLFLGVFLQFLRCFIWCMSRCRESNCGLLLLIIFRGFQRKVSWCSAWGLLHGLWGVSVWLFVLQSGHYPGQSSSQGSGWVNSGEFLPLRLDLGQVSCSLLLSTGLLRDVAGQLVQ